MGRLHGLRYDGSSWVELMDNRVLTLAAPGFNNPSNFGVASMAVRMGDLYFGTTSSNNGCELWRYDGAAMFEVVGGGGAGTSTGPGFRNPKNFRPLLHWPPWAPYSTSNSFNNVTGWEVWSCDMCIPGVSWREAHPVLPSVPVSATPAARTPRVACYGGHVYVGTHNAGGCQVWRYDGLGWIQTVGLGTVVTETAPASMTSTISESGPALSTGPAFSSALGTITRHAGSFTPCPHPAGTWRKARPTAASRPGCWCRTPMLILLMLRSVTYQAVRICPSR